MTITEVKDLKEPCKRCQGYGTVHTGLMECPSTICERCNGLGWEPTKETSK